MTLFPYRPPLFLHKQYVVSHVCQRRLGGPQSRSVEMNPSKSFSSSWHQHNYHHHHHHHHPNGIVL